MSTPELYRLLLKPRRHGDTDQMYDFIEMLTRDPREEIHIPCTKKTMAERVAAKVLAVAPDRTVRINSTELAHYVVVERVPNTLRLVDG